MRLFINGAAQRHAPPDDLSKISALRVDLISMPLGAEYRRPAEIIGAEEPKNFTRRAWIPQTMVDQIWVLYEFPSEDERLKWEGSLSPLMKGWLDRGLLSHALGYGWNVRDYNGFVVDGKQGDLS